MTASIPPYNPQTKFTFQSPKVAYLDNEFMISEDATWEYYQTNSGIFAKNPGNSGGTDPSESIDSRVATIEAEIDTHKEAHNEATEILEQVKDSKNIEEMDDVLSAIDYLKQAQIKSNTF